VRDPSGLKVEVGDHGVICATQGSRTRRGQRRRRQLQGRGDTLPRRCVEETLRLSDLASKSIGGGTLVLERNTWLGKKAVAEKGAEGR
jgi:hypothetical protein